MPNKASLGLGKRVCAKGAEMLKTMKQSVCLMSNAQYLLWAHGKCHTIIDEYNRVIAYGIGKTDAEMCALFDKYMRTKNW